MHLNSARLHMRPLAPEQADALGEIYAEPEMQRWLITRPRSREEFLAIFARALEVARSDRMWAILPRDGDSLIGRAGFFDFGEERLPELVFLLDKSARGKGLATEACACILRYALAVHSWAEVVALVRPENGAAIRVLDKLGFAPDSVVNVGACSVPLYRGSRAALCASLGLAS
jgi:[ribosomal protein S5]-alanine N-acetyltransferase